MEPRLQRATTLGQLWAVAPLVLGIKHGTHQVPWKGAEEISVDMMVESEERGTRTRLKGHMQLYLGDVATQGQTNQCP